MSRPPRRLARRYARAILEVASADGAKAVLALRDELRALVPQLTGHEELQRALAHPALGKDRRRLLVQAMADAAQATPLVKRLVELLGARDRLALLAEVAQAYAELANAAHGVVSAEIVSAVPLADPQQRALERALARQGASVELSTEVDASLVGGLVVRAFGRTYDGSVRQQLAALGRRLAAS